jgi:hypothetical protein
MGSMSASDAAPLPRLGEVFFDVRGESRSMRLSWYADTGVAVFSIWQGGTCTGTFRLPIPDLARMVEALQNGPGGRPEGGPGLTAGGEPGRRGPARAAALPELLDGDIETGQTTAAIHLPPPEPDLTGYHAQAPEEVKPRRSRRHETPPAAPRARPAHRYEDEPPTAYFPGQPAAEPGAYLGQPGGAVGGESYPGDYREPPGLAYPGEGGTGPYPGEPGPGYRGDPLAPGPAGDYRDYRDAPPEPGTYPGDPLAPGPAGDYRDGPPAAGNYPGDPLEPGYPPEPPGYPPEPPGYPGDYREPPGLAYPGEGGTGPYPGQPGPGYPGDPHGEDLHRAGYPPEDGYQGYPPELPVTGSGSRARPYVDGPPEAEDDAYESDRSERGQRRKPRGRRAEPAPDSFPYGAPPGGREPRRRGRDPGRH